MDVDTVIIGSGAGGLTAALALARAGQKVLVLEQHYLPGGWCHSFNLGGYRFSPGVHYIGELTEGGRLRRVYEGLGVADDMLFFELNPDGFDHVLIGDQRFDIPRGRQVLEDRLIEAFPHEAKGIRSYLGAIDRMHAELGNLAMSKGISGMLKFPFKAPMITRYGLRPIDHLLRRHISDPMLRGVLTIQAGDHGLPPERAPAAVHASVVAHYFKGGFYPMGGGRSIPRAFIRGLKRHGGEIRMRARVERILTEGRPGSSRAIGVRLDDGTEIRANHVISNADPQITYGRMLDSSQRSSRLERRLRRTKWSTSCLSLFLAADMDARAMGLDSGNYWYSDTPDIGAGYRIGRSQDELQRNPFPGQFLTVTTLKDPTKNYGTVHTMESFVFVEHDAFKRWASSSYGKRPQDYGTFKQHLQDRMIDGLERIVPGMKDKVVFAELGTPLTNEHYVAATKGNLYGTEKSAFEVGPFAFQQRSEIDNLLLCGASTIGHGVLGATMSGLMAAGKIQGCNPWELVTPGASTVRLAQSDDPSTWPDEVKAKAASLPVAASA